jgi:UDP-2,3-diacylglucosamine pyrophosphatase LpxH
MNDGDTVEPRYSAIEGTEKIRTISRSILKVFFVEGTKKFFALNQGSTVQCYFFWYLTIKLSLVFIW